MIAIHNHIRRLANTTQAIQDAEELFGIKIQMPKSKEEALQILMDEAGMKTASPGKALAPFLGALLMIAPNLMAEGKVDDALKKVTNLRIHTLPGPMKDVDFDALGRKIRKSPSAEALKKLMQERQKIPNK